VWYIFYLLTYWWAHKHPLSTWQPHARGLYPLAPMMARNTNQHGIMHALLSQMAIKITPRQINPMPGEFLPLAQPGHCCHCSLPRQPCWLVGGCANTHPQQGHPTLGELLPLGPFGCCCCPMLTQCCRFIWGCNTCGRSRAPQGWMSVNVACYACIVV